MGTLCFASQYAGDARAGATSQHRQGWLQHWSNPATFAVAEGQKGEGALVPFPGSVSEAEAESVAESESEAEAEPQR